MRYLEGLLYLRRREGEHIGIATGARAMRVTRMDKQLRRAPEQLDAGALLLLLEQAYNRIQVIVRLAQGLAVRRHVAIMEGVEGCLKLFGDFEEYRHARLGQFDAALAGFPGANGRGTAEHVRALATHG